MKVGIFTDSHYSSSELTCGVRYNSMSLRKIKEAYSHFIKEGCELVICLGDVVDTEKTAQEEIDHLKEIGEVIKASGLKTVCLMGNHDAFTLTKDEFYGALGIPEVTEIHKDGVRLIFLDTNYFKSGIHYAPGDSNWQDSFLTNEEKLPELLASSKDKTYIFLHQNIDPKIGGGHRIFNADKVFEIIRDSSVVKGVYQGHCHCGMTSCYDGIDYLTFPAMCEGEGRYYILNL